MKLQDVEMHIFYWLAENLSYRPPILLQRTSKLALLPMAATERRHIDETPSARATGYLGCSG